jgi:DNA replication protein DnaC
METIKKQLKQLRLSSAVASLEERNRYALENKISYVDFLGLLLDDEVASRQNNAYKRRLAQSKLNQQKRLDNYDFTYQPELDKKKLMDLSACRFINENQNIVFMGNPGVGKTHLANGIGLEALKKGHTVMFMHANALIEQLHRSKADGKYHSMLSKISKVDLLIIDEVGFKKFPQSGIDDFFEIIRLRYEAGSIILTTNRSFEDWGVLFGDMVMASAIIDRIVHHAQIIKITGESYRIKGLQGSFSSNGNPSKKKTLIN